MLERIIKGYSEDRPSLSNPLQFHAWILENILGRAEGC